MLASVPLPVCLCVCTCMHAWVHAHVSVSTLFILFAELDLSGCDVESTSCVYLMQLTHLERLNLYRSKIDTHAAVCIIRYQLIASFLALGFVLLLTVYLHFLPFFLLLFFHLLLPALCQPLACCFKFGFRILDFQASFISG